MARTYEDFTAHVPAFKINSERNACWTEATVSTADS